MEKLFRPLRADEIDCRIGSIKKNGLSLLLYKDARCDMNILDETFGPFGWQRHHSRENANCTVSVYDAEKGDWIEKEDTGTESNTEAEKGLASDSFKRACFNWGIGRELYTAPFIWISSDNCNIEARQNGTDKAKVFCFDKFRVVHIAYNDKGEISELIIANDTKGVDVFQYPRKPKYSEHGSTYSEKPAKEPIEAPDGYFYCEKCGQPLAGAVLSNGKKIDHKEVAKRTIAKYGKQLCKDCCKNESPVA